MYIVISKIKESLLFHKILPRVFYWHVFSANLFNFAAFKCIREAIELLQKRLCRHVAAVSSLSEVYILQRNIIKETRTPIHQRSIARYHFCCIM